MLAPCEAELPFLPVRNMLGTDTFAESAGRKIECPFTGQQVVNATLFLGILALMGWLIISTPGAISVGDASSVNLWYWGLWIAAMILGILLVIPIGGADMPVVVSLLNSYSGVAASMAGFVIGNPLFTFISL